MKFFKTTPDHGFTLSIESQLMDQLGEQDLIPTSSIQQLILELELITAEFKRFIEDDADAVKPN